MSEKRRPEIKIVAEILGKRCRVELFDAGLWPDLFGSKRSRGDRRYRVRVNGKWSQPQECFTLTDVMQQLRKYILKRRAR